MQVQWFPGHMHRARKQIQENLKRVDLILEVLDARAPLSCRNPLLNEIAGKKPRIILLNKSDLSDPHSNQGWEKALSDNENRVLLVSAMQKNTLNSLSRECSSLFRDKRWFNRRPVRAMIIGIPNVGKSTIINTLSGGKKAGVANSPGFTKDILRYETKFNLQIYDSPGVLWPKFEDPITGLTLAALGSIRDSILPIEEVALFFIKRCLELFPKNLAERYELDSKVDDPLEWVGKKRGAILPGAIVDRDKASFLILKDLREGRLGKISLEVPGMIKSQDGQ